MPSCAPEAAASWAIVDGSTRQETIHACTEAAAAGGVRPGQRLSTALALDGALRLMPRKPEAEQAALQRLAGWAQQFTPVVILQAPDGLLLEIGACLAYFRGLPRLLALVRQGLAELGYSVRTACAPSCHAALWLAQMGVEEAVPNEAGLPQALHALPVSLLPLPAAQQEKLQLMGISSMGQLLQLPRGGLARRFGSGLPLLLDQALALAPDPRPAYQAPAIFHSRLELSWAADSCADLLFVARRMLVELCGYLAARSLGVQSITVLLEHENRTTSRLPIGFGKPGRNAEALFAILRERLQRFELNASVAAVAMQADSLHELQGRMHDLFGDGGHDENMDLLHNRLRARLGDAALCRVALEADHRPERAWRRVDIDAVPSRKAPAPLPRVRRPAWLLPAPQPLPVVRDRPWYGEALRCVGRPERIESGWWDGDAVVRDYFMARGLSSGRLFWIFQECRSQQWFMHGLFD